MHTNLRYIYTRIALHRHINPKFYTTSSTSKQWPNVKVACGVSGGVDSAVSALLLKQSGCEVVGVFMKNWDVIDDTGECTADKDAADAEAICNHLGIQFRHTNFVKEYWNDVFSGVITDYEAGLTPNPDIECNRYLKFGHFSKYCNENIGCDYVATGHYARTETDINGIGQRRVKLLQAIDRVKDQTFFLSQVRQDSFSNALFPLGNYTKDVVKKIAVSAGLEWVAKKKESMGICFIGKKRDGFTNFMKEYSAPKPGPFVDIETGTIVGEHQGLHFWTAGQRIRLGRQGPQLGNRNSERGYIVSKDVETQTIYVCFCDHDHHPALMADTLFTNTPHWIGGRDTPSRVAESQKRSQIFGFQCDFRFQHAHRLTKCEVINRMSSNEGLEHTSRKGLAGMANWEYRDLRNGGLIVSCAEPQRALTPGQYAVFYSGEECLGSARIERVGPSHYAMNGGNSSENDKAQRQKKLDMQTDLESSRKT